MDRVIAYDGETPQTIDILNTNKVSMNGLAFTSRAWFGEGPAIHGFACTQTQPSPTLFVNIGPGSIYAVDTVDATAYGDMAIDSATVLKQGISYLTQTFATPAPVTGGQSVVYLIQIKLADVDGMSQSVQFYNAGNAPTTQTKNTARLVPATVQIKTGTPAATGSQVTPAPDAGFTGVWAITVANGQTSVTAGNIVLITSTIKDQLAFPNLPTIPPDMQYSVWTYWVDTGAVNALSVTPYPPITALTVGMMLFVKVAVTNTAAVTLVVNSYAGTITKNVKRNNAANLAASDLVAGGIYALIYDGVQWQTLNFFGVASTAQINRYSANQSYGVDHGPPNHIQVSPTPPIISMVAGQVVIVLCANTNTAATDMAVNLNAVVPVIEHNQAFDPISVVPNEIIHTVFDGVSSHKLPKRKKFFTFDVSAPPATPFNMAIGDQLNVTFAGVTSIPLNVLANGGIFSIELIITASNASFSTVLLMPNDTGATGTFKLWYTAFFDDPNGVDPFDLNKIPASEIVTSTTYAGFLIRIFSGRGDLDDNWGNGPFMLRSEICTAIAAKTIHYHSGVFGGPAEGYTKWNDTTTPWTSLGTLKVSAASPGTAFTPLATVSGVAIIKRNA